jgi:Arrestin (or S-antigen), C-terminal domain
VEIRPNAGITAPVHVSLVTVSLQRRETIHPSAESITKKHLAAPRKEVTDIVGKEMLLFRCPAGKEYEEIMSMDLPFVIFIPYYEMVVMLQQGHAEQRKYAFPVPIARYDTLSTFGMYNKPERGEARSDSVVTLGISLPRWSYGPLDPVNIYVKLSPNLDYMSRAKKVTVQKLTYGINEEVIYNHEGDEPQRKIKSLIRRHEIVGVKMPEAGYFTNLGLVFPSKDVRDAEGIMPRGKAAFASFSVQSFTTTAGLYKVEYYLTVKVSLSSLAPNIHADPGAGTSIRSQRHRAKTADCGLSARSC